MHKEFSISISSPINEILLKHLIRDDRQEDLCFALYAPSKGQTRTSAVVHEILLPEKGDRQVHGNVSFNEQYFKRACALAMRKKLGLCFIHSHPFPGWQSMSDDDIAAETKMAPTVFSLTDLPLFGLTVGSDGTWSGRVWNYVRNGKFKMTWASLVKSVGKKLSAYFNDAIVPKPKYREEFKRTRTVYGNKNHETISRLTIGIVGLGSVGSFIAETLARMGFQNFILIDFDRIEKHNLDRQLGATKSDIGKYKVTIAEKLIKRVGTSQGIKVQSVTSSLTTTKGYHSALDADVIFSCVDRPWPRYLLNHIAYAHLIPVIDGGIKVRFEDGRFETAEWQLQTAGPDRPCLQCLRIYEPSEVDLERTGKLDDHSYIEGLPKNHHFKNNENIFPFSANLASMEVFHLIALTTEIGGASFGVQRFRYIHGFISNYEDRQCLANCSFTQTLGTADEVFYPIKP